jgi:hypothetical protein
MDMQKRSEKSPTSRNADEAIIPRALTLKLQLLDACKNQPFRAKLKE